LFFADNNLYIALPTLTNAKVRTR